MSIAKVIVAFIAVLAIVLGSEDESLPDAPPPRNGIADSSKCASELLEWCRNSSTTSSANAGVSVLAMSNIQDSQRVHIFCLRNSTGINCKRNNQSWFSCDSDGNLLYKGEELKPGYQDNDLCKTRDSAIRLFAPPIAFNETLFLDGLKEFRKRMIDFRKRMKEHFPDPFRRHLGRNEYEP
uniref:U22-Theraphotoxin-Ct1c_1 n=1 Tax=Coremiocnemis tropix TaxID=1904443 RepID=A0A482Z9T5_CORTR